MTNIITLCLLSDCLFFFFGGGGGHWGDWFYNLALGSYD